MADPTYKIYLSADRETVLIRPEAEVLGEEWTSIGSVEGADAFAHNEGNPNHALYHHVRDLMYKAYLASGDMSADDNFKHRFAKGLPRNLKIVTLDPAVVLTLELGPDAADIELTSNTSNTLNHFATVSSEGAGDLSLSVYGIEGVASLENTDEVKLVLEAPEFDAEEYKDRNITITAWVKDKEGRTTTISAPAVILHPNTPVYSNDAAITGVDDKVGTKQTADKGTWTNASKTTFTYQWTLDGVVIEGETTDEYTPVLADEGKMLGAIIVAKTEMGNKIKKYKLRTITLAEVEIQAA